MLYRPIIKKTIRLAKTAIGEGDYTTAMRHLQVGLDYADRFGDSDERMYILGAMASISFRQKDFETAESYIIDAMTTKGAHPEAYMSVKCDLIELLLEKGEVKRALDMASEVITEMEDKFPSQYATPPVILALRKFLQGLIDRLDP